MKYVIGIMVSGAFLLMPPHFVSAEDIIGEATLECLDCHNILHPGIVEGWKQSRHSQTTPGMAMAVEGLSRKISSPEIPENLKGTAVGCAECHTVRPDEHADTFDHNGHRVHVVVSPKDCAVCHALEDWEYERNLMSHARKNLDQNAVYNALERAVAGNPVMKDGELKYSPPDERTRSETCFYCHGTSVQVKGTLTKETDFGEMDFPVITGWPNQGAGRENPDGSQGACTACHPRHSFSMEMARKPHTCKECHTGPDVPSYKVYDASKHGVTYSSLKKDWNFKATPWTVGKDFTAPTCATCHISLVATPEGDTVVNRTHRMNDRLPWRIFGLIYAHPHPEKPDTTIIRNRQDLALPTEFSGEPAANYLVGTEIMDMRKTKMKSICRTCHAGDFVDEHWARFEQTIDETNNAVKTATQIMEEIWESGLAKGLVSGGNPFDETIERRWTDIWLIYANTIRFSSAMSGGGDYSVFAQGRYRLNAGIQEMHEWLKTKNHRE